MYVRNVLYLNYLNTFKVELTTSENNKLPYFVKMFNKFTRSNKIVKKEYHLPFMCWQRFATTVFLQGMQNSWLCPSVNIKVTQVAVGAVSLTP